MTIFQSGIIFDKRAQETRSVHDFVSMAMMRVHGV